MIDNATKNHILDTAQILDVVSEFVTLRRRGSSYVGLCPFHNERTASFNVRPAYGTYHCFGCGKSGDAASFVMEHEHMNFGEALRWLARKYGIEIQETELTPEEREAQSRRESLMVVNQYACQWFHDQLLNTPEGRDIGLAYLRSRGFRDDIIERFQLGYSPEGRYGVNPFTDTALSQGYKEDNLVSAGVTCRTEQGRLYDRFHGRVIFPIHSLSGKVVAYSGRILRAKDDKTSKYVNSPESDIYKKSEELYGIWLAKSAIVRQDKCFLVEGNADVVSMHQAGVENVVASCGTSLTNGQIRKIHRFTKNITVIYDGDSAGIHASLRGIDMLLMEGMNVRVVLLPDGEDPDSFVRKQNAESFQNYIKEHEVDFITFKTNLLLSEVAGDPLRRADLVRQIVESIAVIPDEIVRTTYITLCSQRMNMRENVLLREVSRLRKEAYQRHQATVQAGAPSAAPQAAASPIPVSAEQLSASPAAQNTVEVTVAQQPAPSADQSPLYDKEYQLIREMVRHGEEVIFIDTQEDGTETSIKVAPFVMDELAVDGLTFSVPLFLRIAAELMSHIDEPGFKASTYFVRHDDAQVRDFATSLVSERYELSEIFQGDADASMADVIPHLINEYKLEVIEQEIKKLKAQLKQPDVLADADRCRAVMEQYNSYVNSRKTIAKELGAI